MKSGRNVALSLEDLNENLIGAEYEIRGERATRAKKLEELINEGFASARSNRTVAKIFRNTDRYNKLDNPSTPLGYGILNLNIGNPQLFEDQKPITYVRQLISLLMYPELLKTGKDLYPADVRKEANFILKKENMPGGLGPYSASAGFTFVRKAVAKFIKKRDGKERIKDYSNWENVILCDGASEGITQILYALAKSDKDAFLLPKPYYPLYSGDSTLFKIKPEYYALDEKNGWRFNPKLLEKTMSDAIKDEVKPKALIVINPSNPTGSVFTKEDVKATIEFARKNKLVILADEVYQDNIYLRTPKFHSFAKVMHEMGVKDVPLFSFHSVSKGFYGECGLRGGYMEMRNIDPKVVEQLIKSKSLSLCSNTVGQMAVYAMVKPPRGESKELYETEKNTRLDNFEEKARFLGNNLATIKGMSCHVPDGGMYVFPKLGLKKTEDKEFCDKLLDKYGILAVPGSAFGKDDHMRLTILPTINELQYVVWAVKELRAEYARKEKQV